ncbi:hypothetical protein ABT224_19515 [Streptomyces sp. NPDC001584]|uniref:hypothetical protein n=1 Tax=Streptomyces sp. NPDC001584 TaxID=3154521 RepID=UPI0033233853
MTPDRFHVIMTFKAGGPAIEGTWESDSAATGKFQSFVGSHGSVDGVEIVLWSETDGERERVRTWTKERGLEIHREM